jgi:hypothetical protein
MGWDFLNERVQNSRDPEERKEFYVCLLILLRLKSHQYIV